MGRQPFQQTLIHHRTIHPAERPQICPNAVTNSLKENCCIMYRSKLRLLNYLTNPKTLSKYKQTTFYDDPDYQTTKTLQRMNAKRLKS